MWEIWANLLLPRALKVAQSPINRQIWSHWLQASFLGNTSLVSPFWAEFDGLTSLGQNINRLI